MVDRKDKPDIILIGTDLGETALVELVEKVMLAGDSTKPSVVGFGTMEKKQEPGEFRILTRPGDLREFMKGNRAERRKRAVAVRRQEKRYGKNKQK